MEPDELVQLVQLFANGNYDAANTLLEISGSECRCAELVDDAVLDELVALLRKTNKPSEICAGMVANMVLFE